MVSLVLQSGEGQGQGLGGTLRLKRVAGDCNVLTGIKDEIPQFLPPDKSSKALPSLKKYPTEGFSDTQQAFKTTPKLLPHPLQSPAIFSSTGTAA